MKKIIFASGNANIMVEIRQILSDLGMEILSQKEAGIHALFRIKTTAYTKE